MSSKHGDCLHAAIAEGLNSVHQESKFDENQVHEDLSQEILENPHRWHDEYRRKQSRENSWLWFRRGHLMKGAGIQLKEELLFTPRRKTLTRVFVKLASFYDSMKVGCFCQLEVTINGKKKETFTGKGVSGGRANPNDKHDKTTIHAEDKALKQIRKQLEKRLVELKNTNAKVTNPSLEMMLSHSPCTRCRGNISSFLQDSELFPHKKPALTLQVAELYGKKQGLEKARDDLADWIHQNSAQLYHLDTSKLLKNNIKDIKKMFRNEVRKINWKRTQELSNERAKKGMKDVKAVKKTRTKRYGTKVAPKTH